MHLKTILFAYFLIFLRFCDAQGPDEDPVVLRAVRGQEAKLPCGQGRLFLDGPKAYVLWLKNEDYVFRFPNAHSDKRVGKHDQIFGLPCEEGQCDGDTSLRIKMASDDDAGLYRCRIHYQASPSVDYVIQVKIVEPIKVPKIYDGASRIINTGIIEPVPLQSDLTLSCVSENKDRETEVYWRINGAVVTGALITRVGCMIRADIRLNNLTRADVNTKFECMASNADVSEPLVATAILKMYMPPLSVEIRLNNNTDFEAGQPRVVDCVVVGSVPPPTITWYLGDKMIQPSVHKELRDGNFTVSSLTLAPSLQDSGKTLVCQAYNTYIPDGRFDDIVKINVGYRPICGMTRQPKIGSVIGEIEVAVCVVESDPEPLQFSWTFADSNVVYTSSTGTEGYANRYQSRLNWMARGGEIGILSCRAANKFGEMKKPCVFRVTAGGPPHAPDCEVTKEKNTKAIRVKCEKGWDGGRPHEIHLDLVGKDGVRVPSNSTTLGRFYIAKYNDKHNLTGIVYATNSRGISEEKVFNLYMPPDPQAVNYMEHSPVWLTYGQAGAAALTMFIFFGAILLAIKIIVSRRRRADQSPDIVPNSNDEAIHMILQSTYYSSSDESEREVRR